MPAASSAAAQMTHAFKFNYDEIIAKIERLSFHVTIIFWSHSCFGRELQEDLSKQKALQEAVDISAKLSTKVSLQIQSQVSG